MFIDMLFDNATTFKAKIDDVTGFLTAPVALARTGVQHYMGIELGLTDRATEQIGVYRPAVEVFHPDSIKSFVNLVVTNNHPTEVVTTDNVKSLQKGQVSQVTQNNNVLEGVVTITDKNQIKETQNGKVEVSVGYSNNLKEEKGAFDGVQYEFVQTEIRANHLAIVDAGRCGSACRLTMDKKQKELVMQITIDGILYKVEDEQLAQAILKQQKAFKDAEEEMKKKMEKKKEEDEEEIEKLKKEKEKEKATADALKAKQVSDADLNKLVGDRASLLAEAKAILGDKMPDCTDCPQDIKTLVVETILPDMDLKDQSIDYINAAYDIAIDTFKKAKKSLDSLEKNFKDKDGKEITRDSARDKYMKDNLKIVEV